MYDVIVFQIRQSMNSSNFSINHLLNSTEDKQLVVVNNISQGSPKTTSTNSPSSSSSKSDLSSPNSSTTSPSQPKKRLLWKFLLELLDSESGNGIVQWTDREEREFVVSVNSSCSNFILNCYVCNFF